MRGPAFAAAVLVAALFAGCADDKPDPEPVPVDPGPQPTHQGSGTLGYIGNVTQSAITFETLLIDEARAGGEPVIAIAADDSILVSTHPGWTHYHPTADDPD